MNSCCSIVFYLLLLFPFACNAGLVYKRLYDKLLKGYEPLVRPVKNESDPILVKIGIDIQQLINVDEKNQMVQLNIWLRLEWNDVYMRWDPRKFNGINEIRLPSKKVWRPDILLYNSADAKFDTTYDANMNVFSSGRMLWLPPTLITCTCKIDIRWFPFDDQRCIMKFGSWTYSGSAIELIEEKATTATYIEHGAWELKGVSVERNIFKYDCCPEPYYDVTFMLWLRRRYMYYGYTMILPCVLITILTILGFVLPPETGEKLTLETTNFMSLCVFLLMVVEMMPPTSDALPLIGIYFFCTTVVVSVSVCTNVAAMNFHKRTSATYVMSPLFRKKTLSNASSNQPGICIVANEAARLRLGDQTMDELVQIFEELEYINERIKIKLEEKLIDEDWKFVAVVVDRLCLVLFCGFLFAATCAILFAPPHMNV